MQYLLTHLLIILSPPLFDFGTWFIQIELQQTGHVGLCLGFLLLWGSWERDAGSPEWIQSVTWELSWVWFPLSGRGRCFPLRCSALQLCLALPECPYVLGTQMVSVPERRRSSEVVDGSVTGQALCIVCRSRKTWVFAKESLFLRGNKRASLNLPPQMQSLRMFADSKSRVFQGIGKGEGLREKPGSLSSGQVCSMSQLTEPVFRKWQHYCALRVKIWPFDDGSSLLRPGWVIGGFPWLMFPPDSWKITSATVTHTPAVWPVSWTYLWPVRLEEKTENKTTWAEEACLALSWFQRAGWPGPRCLCLMLGPVPAAVLSGSRGQPGYASSHSLPSAFSHLYSWAP